jgi:hypothetical protein
MLTHGVNWPDGRYAFVLNGKAIDRCVSRRGIYRWTEMSFKT